MKATSLLEKQHRKVKTALKKLTHGYDESALHQMASELAAHMVIEETLFYPAIRGVKPDLVAEAYEEHALAEIALQRLLRTKKNDPRFEARAKALFELIEHHVEEEEDELFPKVNKALDDDTLAELGAEMLKQYDDLVARGHRLVLPAQIAETTADRVSSRTDGERSRAPKRTGGERRAHANGG